MPFFPCVFQKKKSVGWDSQTKNPDENPIFQKNYEGHPYISFSWIFFAEERLNILSHIVLAVHFPTLGSTTFNAPWLTYDKGRLSIKCEPTKKQLYEPC
jgi:hypothetical protein